MNFLFVFELNPSSFLPKQDGRAKQELRERKINSEQWHTHSTLVQYVILHLYYVLTRTRLTRTFPIKDCHARGFREETHDFGFRHLFSFE